jgi:hypothetical protein
MIKLIFSLNVLFFSLFTFFTPSGIKNVKPTNMPMCNTTEEGSVNLWTNNVVPTNFVSVKTTDVVFKIDDTKSYGIPLLNETPQGDVLMSWTEKDEQGITALCFSVSKDKGKTFSDKKVVYSGAGVSSSRLFRAKVMAKKDGSLVAVFANRGDAQPQPQAAAQNGGQGRPQGGGGRGGRGGGRASALVYTVSKDGGATWTSPQSVDSDPTPLMRGFFDAIVLPNDEVAVAYLKDVKGSTKHEERDLRMVITKNGVFQEEKLLDAVVCDCCNINLLADANGAVHVYYRDNNDDIRDMARLTTKDNGATFEKSQIVYNDGWKIAGCPHSGAISTTNGNSALVAWYSGASTETGIRLVTQEGKKLLVIDDQSAKNPALMGSSKSAALLWEQGGQLVFRKIEGGKVSDVKTVEGSANGANATGLVLGNQLLIAHEAPQANKKNSLKIATIAL